MNKKRIFINGLIGIIFSLSLNANAKDYFTYEVSKSDANMGLGTIISNHNCFSKLPIISILNNLNSNSSIYKGQILKLPTKYCVEKSNSKFKPQVLPLKRIDTNPPILSETPNIDWFDSRLHSTKIKGSNDIFKYQINPLNGCLYENRYFGNKLIKSKNLLSIQIPCNFR